MKFTEINIVAADATKPNYFGYRVEESHTPPEGDVVVTLTLKNAKMLSSSVFMGMESVVFDFDTAEMSFGSATKAKAKKSKDDTDDEVRGLKAALDKAVQDKARMEGDLETANKQLSTNAETIQSLGGELEGMKARVTQLEAAANKESSDTAETETPKPAAKKAKAKKAK